MKNFSKTILAALLISNIIINPLQNVFADRTLTSNHCTVIRQLRTNTLNEKLLGSIFDRYSELSRMQKINLHKNLRRYYEQLQAKSKTEEKYYLPYSFRKLQTQLETNVPLSPNILELILSDHSKLTVEQKIILHKNFVTYYENQAEAEKVERKEEAEKKSTALVDKPMIEEKKETEKKSTALVYKLKIEEKKEAKKKAKALVDKPKAEEKEESEQEVEPELADDYRTVIRQLRTNTLDELSLDSIFERYSELTRDQKLNLHENLWSYYKRQAKSKTGKKYETPRTLQGLQDKLKANTSLPPLLLKRILRNHSSYTVEQKIKLHENFVTYYKNQAEAEKAEQKSLEAKIVKEETKKKTNAPVDEPKTEEKKDADQKTEVSVEKSSDTQAIEITPELRTSAMKKIQDQIASLDKKIEENEQLGSHALKIPVIWSQIDCNEIEMHRYDIDPERAAYLKRQNQDLLKEIESFPSANLLRQQYMETKKRLIDQKAALSRVSRFNPSISTVKLVADDGRWKYDAKSKTLTVLKKFTPDMLFCPLDIIDNLIFLDIETINLSENIDSIPSHSFICFPDLKTVNGEYVTTVYESAFENSNIQNVNLPIAREINKYAFCNCTNLQNVTISPYAQYDSTTFKNISNTATFEITDGRGTPIRHAKMIVTPKYLIPTSDRKIDPSTLDKECFAEYHFNHGNIREAFPHLLDLYKRGYTRAAILLGDCFYKGHDEITPQNKNLALSLYTQAANAGDTDAMIRLGDHFHTTDKESAWKYYEAACSTEPNHDVNALVKLLDYYPELYDTEIIFNTLLERQKEKSYDPDINFHLGVFYQYGFGTKPNANLALRCYEIAANQGHIKAMNNLGTYFYNESHNYDICTKISSMEAARAWWSQAAERGDMKSKSNLFYLISEEINSLPPTDRLRTELIAIYDQLKPLFFSQFQKSSISSSTDFDEISILNRTVNPKSLHLMPSCASCPRPSESNPTQQPITYDTSISSREAGGLLVVPERLPVVDPRSAYIPIGSKMFDFSQQYIDTRFTYPDAPRGIEMQSIDGNLFEHCPSPIDIIQGEVGDCYFLASLIAIANTDPHAIMSAIRDNGDGTVTVRFFDYSPQHIPMYYRIAKTIPKDKSLNPHLAPWVSLFEKAYVLHRYYNYKFPFFKPTYNQDYANIDGGWPKESIQNIIGNSTYDIPSLAITSTDLFDQINTNKENCYITALFKKIPGIYDMHAYTILGTEVVRNSSGKEIQLIILKNPHGENTPRFIESCGQIETMWLSSTRSKHRNGIFVMPIDKFHKIAEQVTINLRIPTCSI